MNGSLMILALTVFETELIEHEILDDKVAIWYWYVDGKKKSECPQYINCMPMTGGDNKNCNSIGIRACIKAGCTTKAVWVK
jgi:hypothetical protein